MTPQDFMQAARVPETLKPQSFGDFWTIARRKVSDREIGIVGWPTQTLLHKLTWASLHIEPGEVVMEDSSRELRKHLPIWLAAKGRVLVTGLGLGCVVRGLLASPSVEHIDVVELDKDILRVVGEEFKGTRRVSLHHGDALKIDIPGDWDFAWHDLWVDGSHLQRLHAQLFLRYRDRAKHQGAWAFPRHISRLTRWRPLGAPKSRRPVSRRNSPSTPSAARSSGENRVRRDSAPFQAVQEAPQVKKEQVK